MLLSKILKRLMRGSWVVIAMSLLCLCLFDTNSLAVAEGLTTITLDETEVSLVTKNSTNFWDYYIVANEYPGNATDLVWTSSAENIVNIYPDSDDPTICHLEALAAGEATITVTSGDGSASATCHITVTEGIRVTGISLDKNTLTFSNGDPQTLEAAMLPADAANQWIIWETSNDQVAKIETYGSEDENYQIQQIVPVGEGTCTITAITDDGDLEASCSVTVNAGAIVPVTISLDKTELNLVTMNSWYFWDGHLQATVTPANTIHLFWNSSDENIVNIYPDSDDPTICHLEALAAGEATITVTNWDGSASATCHVIVTEGTRVTGMRLSDSALTVAMGDPPIYISAILQPYQPTNENVIWESSNPEVATLQSPSADGDECYWAQEIVKKSPGTTTITATTDDGAFVAQCEVTVVADRVPVTGVNLNYSTLNLIKGGAELILEATVSPDNATYKYLEWSISDNNIAYLSWSTTWGEDSPKRYVMPRASGTTTVTVTTLDGSYEATCVVTVVEAAIPATGINLNTYGLNLMAGSPPVQLIATIEPANASFKNASWNSDNTQVAIVDATGLVTPVGPGTATITAASLDGQVAVECHVTVINGVAVTGITLAQSTMTLYSNIYGLEGVLEAAITPTDATDKDVIWESSDSSIVSLGYDSSWGDNTSKTLLFPQKAGSAVITARTSTGIFSATCEVTVLEGIPVGSLALDQHSLNLTVGDDPVTLAATVLPDNATFKTVSWSSDNETVASIDASGKITPLSPGQACITATTKGGGHSSYCYVTVTSKTPIPVNGLTLSKTSLDIKPGIPAKAITRAELARFLVSSLGLQDATATSSFTDVPATHEYYHDISALYKAGLVNGYEDGSFNPEGNVTRAEYAVVLIRSLGYSYTDDTASVSDIQGNWAYQSISSALNAGLMSLYNDETFRPGDNMTMEPQGQLLAIISPVDAASKKVIWTSSNPSIATVDPTGQVMGISTGQALITAHTVDGNITKTCSVMVSSPPQYGDVSKDGKVDIGDAMLILQKIVGLTQLDAVQMQAANVDASKDSQQNPTIDIGDAMLVLQRIVGLIPKFPAEGL